MNLALPDALHGPSAGELFASMPINASDGQVLAPAAHVEANSIVTFDLGDFQAALCEPFGVEPPHPDELLGAIAKHESERAVSCHRETPARPFDCLEPVVPKFVGRCRPLL